MFYQNMLKSPSRADQWDALLACGANRVVHGIRFAIRAARPHHDGRNARDRLLFEPIRSNHEWAYVKRACRRGVLKCGQRSHKIRLRLR